MLEESRCLRNLRYRASSPGSPARWKGQQVSKTRDPKSLKLEKIPFRPTNLEIRSRHQLISTSEEKRGTDLLHNLHQFYFFANQNAFSFFGFVRVRLMHRGSPASERSIDKQLDGSVEYQKNLARHSIREQGRNSPHLEFVPIRIQLTPFFVATEAIERIVATQHPIDSDRQVILLVQ